MADSSRGAGAHRPTSRLPWPVRGQIVTFLQDGNVANFGRAVATGDVIVDPDTGTRWLPVIKPDLAPALLDITTVIDLDPAPEPPRPRGGAGPDGHGPS
jgi:hypothetical protein